MKYKNWIKVPVTVRNYITVLMFLLLQPFWVPVTPIGWNFDQTSLLF